MIELPAGRWARAARVVRTSPGCSSGTSARPARRTAHPTCRRRSACPRCDQDVQATQPLGCLVDHPSAELRVGEVTAHGHRRSAALGDDAGDILSVVLLGGQVSDRDVGALPRERDRHGRADARVAAGHQRFTPFQTPGAAVRELADVGPGLQLAVQPRLGLMLLGRFDHRVPGHRVLEDKLIGSCGVGIGVAHLVSFRRAAAAAASRFLDRMPRSRLRQTPDDGLRHDCDGGHGKTEVTARRR